MSLLVPAGIGYLTQGVARFLFVTFIRRGGEGRPREGRSVEAEGSR